jgi:hypothetical protein
VRLVHIWFPLETYVKDLLSGSTKMSLQIIKKETF